MHPRRPAAYCPAAPRRSAEPRRSAKPRRPAEPGRPAESRRPTEPRCPPSCTAPAAIAATAATAAMASPSVLTFDAKGRAVDFDMWVDDLQLVLQCDSRDGVSLFDHTSGVSTAPIATADNTVHSQWSTRDAVARLAVRSHMPPAERAHFGQYKTAKSLYDAVVARYSSPATAALSRLMLPYLFLDLAAFATVADLITHLRTRDARYRAALPTEDHFHSLCPTELTVDLLEERLAVAEKSILAVGASRGDRRTPFFEGCSPVPLLPSVASAAAVNLVGTEEVGAASAPNGRRHNTKGKGSKGGGGDGGGGGGGGGGDPVGPAASRRGETCGLPHTAQRCFGRLTDAWRAQFPDAVELPRWGDMLRQNVAIFDLDFDAILATMYALTDSAEGDCNLSVPPDPGIEAAALGASASAAPGTGESAAPGAAPHSRRLVGLSQSPWLTPLGAQSLRTLPRFYRVMRPRRACCRDSTSGTVDPGAGGAGAGGAVLGLPSSTGLIPPLLCPPTDNSQPPLQPASPLPAPSPYTKQTGGLTERREHVSCPASPVRAIRTGRRVPCPRPPPVPGTPAIALCASFVPLRVPLTPPPESSLLAVPNPESDHARAASPTVSRLLATIVTNSSFESTAASALVAEMADFAAACRLDYATTLVAESVSASPPSVEGECALGTDVLEDRQEDLECLAAAVPCFASMLLAPEGDPYAPDIPTPRSYVEAITGPYSSQWQAAMDAKMASWKSTGNYIDADPPSRANIVDGMWIFKVKRPPGSPPALKARYVARGFSQRQGLDYFQTFSPTQR
ncbi:unnamed protein product [Closterium sp. NIES-53]